MWYYGQESKVHTRQMGHGEDRYNSWPRNQLEVLAKQLLSGVFWVFLQPCLSFFRQAVS